MEYEFLGNTAYEEQESILLTKTHEAKINMKMRLTTVILVLSLAVNVVALVSRYNQLLRNRDTETDLVEAIALTQERLAVTDQTTALYVEPLARLERVRGRLDASAHGNRLCREEIRETINTVLRTVQIGVAERGWVKESINRAQAYCLGYNGPIRAKTLGTQ